MGLGMLMMFSYTYLVKKLFWWNYSCILNSVYNWTIENNPRLNILKILLPIVHNDEVIGAFNKVLNLGVVFDYIKYFHLEAHQSANKVCGISMEIFQVIALFNSTQSSCRFMYSSINLLGYCFRQEFFYCSKTIMVVYKSCIRYTNGLQRGDCTLYHYLSEYAFWMRNFLFFSNTSCFMFKIICSRRPQYLYEKLDFSRSARI